MFGSDFTRYNEKDDKKVTIASKRKSNEPPVNIEKFKENQGNLNKEKHEDKDYMYTLKVLFYFNKDEYIKKFLKLFKLSGKFQKSYLNTIGMEPISIYGYYKETKICISLWIMKSNQRYNDMQEFFNRGAHVVLVYYDIQDTEYILKLKEWIGKIRVFSDAKFLIIIDKEDLNSELKTIIKSLIDEEFIQGFYKIDTSITDNNDRLVKQMAKIAGLKVKQKSNN